MRFGWRAVCGTLLLAVALLSLGCRLDSPFPRLCARQAFDGAVAYGALVASLAAGLWLGTEASERSLPWVGWIVGLCASGALVTFLNWIGMLPAVP